MKKIPLIWSNDDITAGTADKLRRQLAFIDRFDIPGVFFVIPRESGKGKNIDEDPELLRLIEKSRKRGHEYYQHGFVHTAFECGVPETWMLDMAPDVRKQYDIRRLEIERGHTFEAQTEMLENGRKIWRRAFAEDSTGFRPGWGAFCGNFYKALEVLGFAWTSSRIPSPTSWKWNNGLWDESMDFRKGVAAGPTMVGRVREYPIAGDYAFRVPHEATRIDAMVGLALREMAYFHQRGLPMILCSHWHGLEHAGGSGYAVHEKLLAAMLKSGTAEPMNMTQLEARTQKKAGKKVA
jgi:hypothetical protein